MGWGNMLGMLGGGGLMFVNPALGAGVMAGSLKNMEGQNKADKQRQAQAEIQRWSPWTGLQGQQVQDPSLMGDLATGAALGGMGQKMFPGAGAVPLTSIESQGVPGLLGPSTQANAGDGLWSSLFARNKPSLYSN